MQVQHERRLQNGDLRELKELLGLTQLDFSWLMAVHVGPGWISANPDHARNPIEDPVLSGLTRLLFLLATRPDFHVLPLMPTAPEVFEALREPYLRVTGRDLNAGRFAALCLVSAVTGAKWVRSSPVTTRSQRHLFLLNWLVQRGGDKALREYLRVLDLEAKTRGFEDLEGVIRARSWTLRRPKRVGRQTARELSKRGAR